LRRLQRAVQKQDRVALTAVWQQWLDRPSPALWAFLSVWGRGPLEWNAYETSGLRDLALHRLPDPRDRRFAAVVVAALVKRGHPVARTTAELILNAPADVVDAVCAAALVDQTGVLVAFCVEHGLAPADPVQRAMFLARTGQDGPNIDLLTAGYAGADRSERQRLRGALRSEGKVDLVEVVVGEGRSRAGVLDPNEVADVADWLGARQDWAGLWRLAGEVSPAAAVDLARIFPATWRPGDSAGRRLFETLTATPPEALRAYVERRKVPVSTNPVVVSFAPDGAQFAVFGHSGPSWGPPVHCRLAFYALPDATLLREHTWDEPRSWCAGGLIHVGGGTAIRTGQRPLRFTIDGAAGGVPLAPDGPFQCRVEQYRNGYVGAHGQALYVGSYANPERPRVSNLLRREFRPENFAVEPGTGRFAVLDVVGRTHRLVLFARNARVLATSPVEGTIEHLAFAGPDRLITAGSGGGLVLWHRDRDRLHLAATTEPFAVNGLHALPAIQKIGVLSSGWDWYSTESLLPTGPAFASRWPERRWTSPDGEWSVAASAGTVWLHRLVLPAQLARLVDRPLVSMGPADLSTVVKARPSNAAAMVVRACLKHRFARRP
jgi:hypothetical protein